jgi:hypothetical protein
MNPQMRLNLPSYAAVYLPYFPPPLPGEAWPEADKELTGELEILIPPQNGDMDGRRGRSSRAGSSRNGSGSGTPTHRRGVRVKAIRLILRTYLRITTVAAGKKGKNQAEKVIFERKIENVGGEEGILLEEGTQR